MGDKITDSARKRLGQLGLKETDEGIEKTRVKMMLPMMKEYRMKEREEAEVQKQKKLIESINNKAKRGENAKKNNQSLKSKSFMVEKLD